MSLHYKKYISDSTSYNSILDSVDAGCIISAYYQTAVLENKETMQIALGIKKEFFNGLKASFKPNTEPSRHHAISERAIVFSL